MSRKPRRNVTQTKKKQLTRIGRHEDRGHQRLLPALQRLPSLPALPRRPLLPALPKLPLVLTPRAALYIIAALPDNLVLRLHTHHQHLVVRDAMETNRGNEWTFPRASVTLTMPLTIPSWWFRPEAFLINIIKACRVKTLLDSKRRISFLKVSKSLYL